MGKQRQTGLCTVTAVAGVEPFAYSYADAGRALSVSARTIRREVKDGRLAAIAIRGSPRITTRAIHDYIEEREGIKRRPAA